MTHEAHTFTVVSYGPFRAKVRMEAFADGVRALGGRVLWIDDDAELQRVLATQAVRFAYTCGMRAMEARGRDILSKAGVPLLVLDLGYFNRASGPKDQSGYNQLGVGGLCWTPPVDVPADRFEAHGLTVAQKRAATGKPTALILGQVPGDSQHHLNSYELSRWLGERAEHWARKGYAIAYRPHPSAPSVPLGVDHRRIDPTATTVTQDIADPSVAVAVAYNSTAGLEALMAGVPVDCAPCAHYAHVADLSDRDALLKHLHRLAYAQWTCPELRSGEPLRYVLQFIEPPKAPEPVIKSVTVSNEPRIVTLFYGDVKSREAYRTLLDEWLDHHVALGLADRITVVTDHRSDVRPLVIGHPGVKVAEYDVAGYADVIRPGQPFDVKGALMCELLADTSVGPFLLLDNDAMLQREDAIDELPAEIVIGMSRDLGALESTYGMHLHEPFAHVFKRCAGVAWFGDTDRQKRDELRTRYLDAWRTLVHGGKDGGVPWEKQLDRLLEQHAWSYAAQQMEQPLLPDSWNWPSHIDGYAAQVEATKAAHVHHLFGRKKWKRLGRKAPLNT